MIKAIMMSEEDSQQITFEHLEEALEILSRQLERAECELSSAYAIKEQVETTVKLLKGKYDKK